MITNAALWSESNLKLQIAETNSPGLSTIKFLKDMDTLSRGWTVFKEYEVNTISLTDLVRRNNAPHGIDYLSLDTEGSEYEVLKDFDIANYSFNVTSVEHTWNEINRKMVTTPQQNHGYLQTRAELTDHESWFIGGKLFLKFKERGRNFLVQLN